MMFRLQREKSDITAALAVLDRREQQTTDPEMLGVIAAQRRFLRDRLRSIQERQVWLRAWAERHRSVGLAR